MYVRYPHFNLPASTPSFISPGEQMVATTSERGNAKDKQEEQTDEGKELR